MGLEAHMRKMKLNHAIIGDLTNLSLSDLRQKWAEVWDAKLPQQIGRGLLEKSLAFKIREMRGEGLSEEQRKRLDHLVVAYKRNPNFFDEGLSELKPGIRLVKKFNGEHHSVLVHAGSYEYRDKHYRSLSEIATVITGTRWNGWVFFGLKKRKEKS